MKENESFLKENSTPRSILVKDEDK